MEGGDRERAAIGHSESSASSQGKRPPARQLTSAALFAGASEVLIAHEGELYRLRCTSRGKLILTK